MQQADDTEVRSLRQEVGKYHKSTYTMKLITVYGSNAC
jgi:hypothetical protein